MAEKLNIVTPVGELMHVRVTGQGKENYEGDGYEYTACIVLDKKPAKELKAQIDEFYDQENNSQWDEAQNKIMTKQDDGRFLFSFSTKTSFTNDKGVIRDTKIKVKDGKKNDIHVTDDLSIGNGSVGRISGSLKFYKRKDGAGVSMFLNSIQLKTFVPYTGGDDFDEMDGAEDIDIQSAEAPKSDKKDKKKKKKKSKEKSED